MASTILAGGNDSSRGIVLLSTDTGATWDAGRFVGSGNITIRAMVKLANGNVLSCGSPSVKCYKSTDGGNTWDAGVSVGGSPRGICQLSNGNVLIVDDNGLPPPSGHVYQSVDNGATFTTLATIHGISLFDVLQLANGNVIARTGTGLVISTDGGSTWGSVISGSPLGKPVQLANGHVLVADGSNLHTSTDNGNTWSTGGTVPGNYLTKLSDETLCVLSGRSVYKSSDVGVTWDGGTAISATGTIASLVEVAYTPPIVLTGFWTQLVGVTEVDS